MSASVLNSCSNQILTIKNILLGDGKMEKLVMCRKNRDFTVFMHKHYPQVADEQFEFGVFNAKDKRKMSREWI